LRALSVETLHVIFVSSVMPAAGEKSKPAIVGCIFGLVSSPCFERALHCIADAIPRKQVLRFFHCVNDPHSHLALQALPLLVDDCAVSVEMVLISDESLSGFASSKEDVQAWVLQDGNLLRGLYADLDFSLGDTLPSPETSGRAATVLAALVGGASGAVLLTRASLLEAVAVGRALWRFPLDTHAFEEAVVAALASSPDAQGVAREALAAGLSVKDQLRSNYDKLCQKHLAGGVVCFRGEPYWGIDRLAHLERRLGKSQRFGRSERLRFAGDAIGRREDGELPVELIYSFRSPYSQLVLRDLFKLCDHYGVPLRIRPVLPMAMRGKSVDAKKVYIMRDFFRENNRMGLPFGRLNDPLGEPTLRALRVWPLAQDRGREREFAWAWATLVYGQFVPAGTDEGMRRIVEEAGLCWDDAAELANGDGVPAFEGENRRILLEELKLWGVPTIRYGPLALWGQDRLWALEQAIQTKKGMS